MIIVDEKKCRGCGLRAAICCGRCIAVTNGSGGGLTRIDHALCSTCTQCIAVCPRQALSWDLLPPVAYERGRLPSAEQLDELFRQRRTGGEIQQQGARQEDEHHMEWEGATWLIHKR